MSGKVFDILTAVLICGAMAFGAEARSPVQQDGPAAYWSFESQDALRGAAHGARVGVEGPRPGAYPDFAKGNRAAAFEKAGARIEVDGASLAFDQGETITVEAWVELASIGEGQNVYLIGKGRTAEKDNQNWALRLRGVSGSGRPSFLFRGRGESGSEGWHRWTAHEGLAPASGWHHVAVTYTFGEPKSIRCVIDGRSAEGAWDMGGASKAPPVVDDAPVWIGSSMGGSADSTLRGKLDEVAVFRKAVPTDRLKARYRFVPPKIDLAADDLPDEAVRVEIFEGIGTKYTWNLRLSGSPTEQWNHFGFAHAGLPHRYTSTGVIADRDPMFLLRTTGKVSLPEGRYRVLLRSFNGARLHLDGRRVAETRFTRGSGSAHEKYEALPEAKDPSIRPLGVGHTEKLVELELGGMHVFRLDAMVGGKSLRPEIGELMVAIAPPGEPFRVLAPKRHQAVDDAGWLAFEASERARIAQVNAERRRTARADEDAYWKQRHAQGRQAIGPRPEAPKTNLPVFNHIDRYLGARLESAGAQPTPLIDDDAFVRRLSLDTRGIVASPEEILAFRADRSQGRHARLVDRFLDDPRWADHWTAYWQDVLAENPGILKPKLNNSGPFRWWIHESLLDNKPIDRFATELVMMRGSRYGGGPAGFAMASQNDVPMAAKAHILGTAFLGVEMKCARCHDAPYHDLTQEQLFSMAAMLERRPVAVPKSSSIPLTEEEISRMVVEVTLKPGARVEPKWSFENLIDVRSLPEGAVADPKDTRQRLAALITHSDRFAQVIVNRLWKRLMGYGFVEPAGDWEGAKASHPALMKYLAWELVAGGYDLKHVARLILNSHAYRRTAAGDASDVPIDSAQRLFAGPARRRMTAEQLVDSLFFISGKPMASEPLNMDLDGRRAAKDFLNLGKPTRAWQFTSLSNERDRPSLGMPRAQSVVDLLGTFGWRQARQDPLTVRDATLTPLQPLMLANGTVPHRAAIFSEDSAFTSAALREDATVESFTRDLFRRVLGREPAEDERAWFTQLLSEGFEHRLVSKPARAEQGARQRSNISWSNHFSVEANRMKLQQERALRAGDPPTPRLTEGWRRRAEDAVWALFNTPEFIFVP